VTQFGDRHCVPHVLPARHGCVRRFVAARVADACFAPVASVT